MYVLNIYKRNLYKLTDIFLMINSLINLTLTSTQQLLLEVPILLVFELTLLKLNLRQKNKYITEHIL